MKIIKQPNSGILLLNTCKGIELIPVDTIIRIESISNYSKLFFNNGSTLVVAKILKWFENILTDKGFARIHRSHLINISCITGYKNSQGEKLVLQNLDEVDISRRRKADFINLLWQKKVNAGTKTKDVSRYAKGTYLLNANNTTEKVVLQ